MPLIVNELQRRNLKIPGVDRRSGYQPPFRPAHPADRARAPFMNPAFIIAKMLSRAYRPWIAVTDAEQRAAIARADPAGVRDGAGTPGTRLPAILRYRRVPAFQAAHIHSPARPVGGRAWSARCRWRPSSSTCPRTSLFRLSWGAKNTHGEEWEKLQAEFEARLEPCAVRPCKKDG